MIELDSLDQYNEIARLEEVVKRVPELELLQGGGVLIEFGEGEGASSCRGAKPGPVPRIRRFSARRRSIITQPRSAARTRSRPP